MDTRRRACTITSRQRRSADRTDRFPVVGFSGHLPAFLRLLTIDVSWGNPSKLFCFDRETTNDACRGADSKKEKHHALKHIFVEQEPPFKGVPATEAAEIDYRALKSFLS
jgi:hypothetical protein